MSIKCLHRRNLLERISRHLHNADGEPRGNVLAHALDQPLRLLCHGLNDPSSCYPLPSLICFRHCQAGRSGPPVPFLLPPSQPHAPRGRRPLLCTAFTLYLCWRLPGSAALPPPVRQVLVMFLYVGVLVAHDVLQALRNPHFGYRTPLCRGAQLARHLWDEQSCGEAPRAFIGWCSSKR